MVPHTPQEKRPGMNNQFGDDPGFKVNRLNDQFVASNYLPSTRTDKVCQFGLECLDDGLVHIFQDDLILVGAPTGMGKTQLCTHFAMINAMNKKRVYYVALEAAENEIKDRILYTLYTKYFYADTHKAWPKAAVNYLNWSVGKLRPEFDKYIVDVEAELQEWPSNINIVSRTSHFDVTSLERLVNYAKMDQPDLFIIDHAHYFDTDAANENRALKEITMACRDVTQLHGIPVILVAHLRKKQQNIFDDPVPGINEFHGSSDLTKIATRVITLSQGAMRGTEVDTYFRVAKDRRGSQLTKYITACKYSLEHQSYLRPNYVIGDFKYEKGAGNVFTSCGNEDRPKWALNARPPTASM